MTPSFQDAAKQVILQKGQWIRIRGEGKFDGEEEAYTRWRAKSEWHEKTYGW